MPGRPPVEVYQNLRDASAKTPGQPKAVRPDGARAKHMPVRPRQSAAARSEMKSSSKMRQADAMAAWGCTCHCPLQLS